jgi:hypothetical protein
MNAILALNELIIKLSRSFYTSILYYRFMKGSRFYSSIIIMIGAVIMASLIFAPFISQHQAFAAPEKISLQLKVDPKTIKLTDINNNKKPDPGEFVGVLGKLYAAGTQNEIGTYRCTFSWGGWSNSTAGVPVAVGTQVFDIKGNGTIVVVGDEPGEGEGIIGKPVEGTIAGGTGSYKTITDGIATLTQTGGMELPLIPFNVVLIRV